MLIHYKNKKIALNMQCVSELFIQKNKKSGDYTLNCTMLCSANGINQRTLATFGNEQEAIEMLEKIVNRYEKGDRIFKVGKE